MHIHWEGDREVRSNRRKTFVKLLYNGLGYLQMYANVFWWLDIINKPLLCDTQELYLYRRDVILITKKSLSNRGEKRPASMFCRRFCGTLVNYSSLLLAFISVSLHEGGDGGRQREEGTCLCLCSFL